MENHDDAPAIRMPIIDVISNKPDFLPLGIPKEFLGNITSFHGDPFIWWAGQILNYLMRFNSDFENIVKLKRQTLKFQTPAVG